jgi:hypothetical protein
VTVPSPKRTASMLLASIRKHRPMLQQTGCKPALHLVAQNQMDRAALGSRPSRKHRPMLQQAQQALRGPWDGASLIAPSLKVRAGINTFLLVAGSSLLQQKDRGAWFTPKCRIIVR